MASDARHCRDKVSKLGLSHDLPQTCIEACPSCGVLGDGTILRILAAYILQAAALAV